MRGKKKSKLLHDYLEKVEIVAYNVNNNGLNDNDDDDAMKRP